MLHVGVLRNPCQKYPTYLSFLLLFSTLLFVFLISISMKQLLFELLRERWANLCVAVSDQRFADNCLLVTQPSFKTRQLFRYWSSEHSCVWRHSGFKNVERLSVRSIWSQIIPSSDLRFRSEYPCCTFHFKRWFWITLHLKLLHRWAMRLVCVLIER